MSLVKSKSTCKKRFFLLINEWKLAVNWLFIVEYCGMR